MKLAGHTMGMPEMDIFEAISFCAEIGLDGIEVRCAENGQMHLESLDGDEIKRIRDHAQQEGVEFACLTPYYRHFVTDLEKQAAAPAQPLPLPAARLPRISASASARPVAGRMPDALLEYPGGVPHGCGGVAGKLWASRCGGGAAPRR
ncbi:MAG: hypothetical protein ACOCYG_07585 [Spirochaetota bacterium]